MNKQKNIFKSYLLIPVIIACIIYSSCNQNTETVEESNLIATTVKLKGTAKARLSEYGFFKDLKNHIPADDVMPYELNSPLFSDYAHKARFVKLPEGASTVFNPKQVFDFPQGTTIIKTFYYPSDFRDAGRGRLNIETRLLVHEEKGWAAYSYVWNEEQTDALYEVAGGRKDISWVHYDGTTKNLNYVIPNVNQCKGCHTDNGRMTPIGPSARQLNGTFVYHDGTKENQLLQWQKKGILNNLPDITLVDKAAHPDDPHATLEDKARAYLDVNCAHCHKDGGPAVTSGFLTDFYQTDKAKLGFYKGPVAAGRGSGNRKYDIVPGKPDESIVVFRMESTDPGIMMPELARKMKHDEGVKLIRDWIASLKDDNTQKAR
jgi:uncharacterized repeat protein (TIGR03806 family)